MSDSRMTRLGWYCRCVVHPCKYLWVALKFREWPPWSVVYISFRKPSEKDITRTLELAKEHGWLTDDSGQGD